MGLMGLMVLCHHRNGLGGSLGRGGIGRARFLARRLPLERPRDVGQHAN